MAGMHCCNQASSCPKVARAWRFARNGQGLLHMAARGATEDGRVCYRRRWGLLHTVTWSAADSAGVCYRRWWVCYTRRQGLLPTAVGSATHGGRRCFLRPPTMLSGDALTAMLRPITAVCCQPTPSLLRPASPPPLVLRAGVEAPATSSPAKGGADGGVTGVALHCCKEKMVRATALLGAASKLWPRFLRRPTGLIKERQNVLLDCCKDMVESPRRDGIGSPLTFSVEDGVLRRTYSPALSRRFLIAELRWRPELS
jgi:hypothetical protein